MFRKLSTKSSPKTKQASLAASNFSSKPRSRSLITCSAALPDLAVAKSAPPEALLLQKTQAFDGYRAELLPPEIVISILNGFAKAVLVENERFERLKLKCLEGAKLGHDVDHDAATPMGSILKSSHTVLTYLSWGIRHIEKALAKRENKEEHLEKADLMLRSLIDSVHMELDDRPTAMLTNVCVPNAGFILGLAHVFLALVQKMKKNSSKVIVSLLLNAFVVSPREARESFIPELWSQLFRPHLAAVEAWYKKERANVTRSISLSSCTSDPPPPSSTNKIVVPTNDNTVVFRANALMDIFAGMQLSKRGVSPASNESKNVQDEHDQSKHLDKMSIQVNLLSNIYEQSLDEGTVQYARHYQDLITSYYERFSFDQALKPEVILHQIGHHSQMQPAMSNLSGSHNNQELAGARIQGAAAPQVSPKVDNDEENDEVISRGGWMGANALQLRRSLYEAIFGTVPMEITSKNRRNDSSNTSSQATNLLRMCSKKLPEVLDPLKSKGDQDKTAHTHVVTDKPKAGSQSVASKPATIRDMVNLSLLSEAQKDSKPNLCNSELVHSQTALSINGDSIPTPDQASNNTLLLEVAESTELQLARQTDDYPETMLAKKASVIKTLRHSKRLIDYIKDPDNQSDGTCSSTQSNIAKTAGNQISKTCQQRRMSLTIEGIGDQSKVRMMKRRNSESSAPVKSHDHWRLAPEEQGSKRQVSSQVSLSKRKENGRNEIPRTKSNHPKPNMVHRKKVEEATDEATDVQVKYCTSLQVHQTPSSTAIDVKSHAKANVDKDKVPSQPLAPLKGAGVNAGELCDQLEDLANELRMAVRATQICGSTLEGVERCEKALLKLSQAWLEFKSATLLKQKKDTHKEADSPSSTGITALEGLTEELLFILTTSKLQEAQRLALCLLPASMGSRKTHLTEMPMLQQHDPLTEKEERCERKPTAGTQLPYDPNVWQALSHLLEQQGRLPEAALLLHLLNPAQYSASCHHFLPHLLPILLDLAQCNIPPTMENAFHRIVDAYDSRLRLVGDSLKPRALALMMMSRLLAAVDGVTRLQACKHVLFPNVNALPCLLHSLDSAQSLDERAAAAFILTTCMQADEICRQHVVTHVKLTTVVALLQQSASNASAFQTSINFVSELLRTRKAKLTEMLGCIRQDGLLNCMHALMAYLQTASLENQPPAAGLLLQLDLLLGDEQKYSIFREEALEALLAPLLSESNKEASFIAARVLSTIGQSHSEQELEAWLLKKAGLGSVGHESFNNSSPQQIHTTSFPAVVASTDEEDEEEKEEVESSAVVEWDERVARAFIRQGGGLLVSGALANGLRSSMAEVRKACLLVAAWLTSHLSKMHHLDQTQYKVSRLMGTTAKERMREALQAQLQEIAAVNSGSAIVERVFAALALQNLAK